MRVVAAYRAKTSMLADGGEAVREYRLWSDGHCQFRYIGRVSWWTYLKLHPERYSK